MFGRRVVSARARGRASAVVGGVAAFCLTAGVASAATVPAYQALKSTSTAPTASLGTPVTGLGTVAHKNVTVSTETDTSYKPAASSSTWPAASSGSLILATPLAAQSSVTQNSANSAAQNSAAQGATVSGTRATASGTPVWAQAVADKPDAYTGPKALSVAVSPKSLATELGVSGVVFTVTGSGAASAGSVRVGLDYASFADAVGGNYASRLRLVELPACALTTPKLAKCQVQTPLTSTNSQADSSVSAVLNLGSSSATGVSADSASANAASVKPETTVLGATDSTGQEGGQGGDYASDSMSSAGSWAQSGSSGDYTYTYDVGLPSSSSSLTPDASLEYDSGTVDGTTSTTQAQSSWAGDGWATQDSYVQQSFIPCDDTPEGSAGSITTTDECYDGQLLTLSLDGTSTQIVDDGGTYTLSNDDGALVSLVTGSNNGSGTYNTDYWKITERDGTTYYFGRNELPGYASTDAMTNSVDSVRVYSAHSGDPCYNATPANSYCTMAYKWHLDYVVDAKSQAMAYYYDQATNSYGANKGTSKATYIRDSYLAHIDYGFTTATGPYGTVPDKVVYSTGLRCVSGATDCGTAETSSNETYYPDVPFDLEWTSSTTLTSAPQAPSFFSTVALNTITTEQYSVTAGFETVDSYALTQTMPSTGDATSSTLWLASVQHTGEDENAGTTTTVSEPEVSFAGTALANRVDTASLPTMYRFRLTSVTNEMGGVIGITYGLPQACSDAYVTGQTATSASSNTESCFPVYWTPEGYTAPIMDWFNEYAVTQVLETDTTGGSDAMQSNYAYSGAAWHYDDDPTTKAKYRTWGQWRGYESVTTTTGASAINPLTQSTTLYYQGMNGDYLTPTTTRSVSLPDSLTGSHVDYDELAGQALETEAYLGNGGPLDHYTINSYWVSPALATQSLTGLPALTSNMTGIAEAYTGQALTDGNESAWRFNETDTSYDTSTTDGDYGLAVYSYSHTAPVNTAYDKCTTATYTAPNTTLNIVGLVGLTEIDALACSGFTEGTKPSVPSALNTLGAPSSLSRPADVLSANETFYDSATSITTPATVGLATKKQSATGYGSGAWTWKVDDIDTYTTAAAFSRLATTTNGDNDTTTSTYTLNTANLTTGESTQNALGQTTSKTFDPEHNLTLTSTDANGVVTTYWYDALGRVIDEWDYSHATSASANKTYAYTESDTGISGTVTQTLDNESVYVPSVTILDSLGRTRQTQTAIPSDVGRLVTDTLYDSRGLVAYKNVAYYDNTVAPYLELASVATGEVPDQEVYAYDGLGRQVEDQSLYDGTVVSTSYTVENGDCSTSVPPTGGVWKTTCTDPTGRTSAVTEYSANPTLTVPANVSTSPLYLTGGTPVTTTTTYGFDTTSGDPTYGDAYTTTTDASGEAWTSWTDLAGDAVEKVDPTAGTSYLAYDADGNLTQSKDARGEYVSYTYDKTGRKTAEFASTTAAQALYVSTASPGNETASWVYDDSNSAMTSSAYAIGQTTTKTSYTGGYAYVDQYTSFNVFGKPLGETVTVPNAGAATSVLAGSYSVTHVYGAVTGPILKDIYTATGGLASETVLHSYTSWLDLPNEITGGGYGYAQAVSYDAWSRPVLETLGSGTYGEALLADTYDPHTGRLLEQLVTRTVDTPTNVDQVNYTYDLSGNITSKAEERLGSTSDTETQCYLYNDLDQLTTAWSATSACSNVPSTSNYSMVGNALGDSSAYWDTWTYNNIGDRTQQDQHSLTNSADDAITTYTYNGNGASQPNTLTSTKTTVNGVQTAATSYVYDVDGNATKRNNANGNQTLTWNNAGQLTQDSDSAGATNYVYDADGTLLLQEDPTTSILYVGEQQVTVTISTGAETAIRYYPLPGGGTAVRTGTGSGFSFEITDMQSTGDLYLDYTAQIPTWREFDPYGNERGTAVTWIDNRTLMGKATDTVTGLTDVGARYLDTTTGTFVSLDPVFEATDTLALNGYSYTSDNPVTEDDPTGQMFISVNGCVGSIAYCDSHGNNNDNDNDNNDPGKKKHGGGGNPKGTASNGNDTTRPGFRPPIFNFNLMSLFSPSFLLDLAGSGSHNQVHTAGFCITGHNSNGGCNGAGAGRWVLQRVRGMTYYGTEGGGIAALWAGSIGAAIGCFISAVVGCVEGAGIVGGPFGLAGGIAGIVGGAVYGFFQGSNKWLPW